MTEVSDQQKDDWIIAAGEAFIAIRLVTGYGRRTEQPLDEDTVYAVTQLADMLHNIGALATSGSWSTDYHTPEKLDRVRASTSALGQRYQHGLPRLHAKNYVYQFPKKSGLIARMAQAITRKRT